MTVVLTFAELACLLPEAASSARRRLHLLEWDAESPVPLAGVASLVVRGLVRFEESGSSVPVDEVSSVIATIANAVAWVQIGFARENAIGGIQICDAEDGMRVEATAQPFGAFAFTLTEASVPLANAAGVAVRAFLGTDESGAVFIKTGGAEADGDGLAVRQTDTGTIEVAVGKPDDAPIRELALDDAIAAVESYVDATSVTRAR